MNSRSKSGIAVTKESTKDVSVLLAALENSSPIVRGEAREELVGIGHSAVPLLIPLLSHRKTHVRWEAAKALGSIADPIAATALVNAMKDRDSDVRWLAAEGLAAIGREGLPPLLAALIDKNQVSRLCEGSHHVCHRLVVRRGLAKILRPLLEALSHAEPEVAVPPAAYDALTKLREIRS